MSQAKKIFTRMCLNNWGGINHKVLEFNEYVIQWKKRIWKIDRYGCNPGYFIWKLQSEFFEQGGG